ncbi:COPII coat complex component Sec24 D (Sec24D) [Carpediemonas membranifera]|uniref:COPII coat complex component Sec24 D (Sec24D) n=1 Tax=Carpediemonas membranifera TaxID=201153 RepID=A0A8J6ARW1_9EUKA|nr:COPII coat complex component Sec24 D (Sec24D) [Carpediemonas membranifera]|eukprot:KAG9392458.1 COPII coat complex component Sec24 D (Sec24D) [Carpediemonas membranifera]
MDQLISLPNPLSYCTDADGTLLNADAFEVRAMEVPVRQPSLFRQWKAIDGGNATARHIRPTIAGFPERQNICKSTDLPFGFHWRPVANTYPDESPVVQIACPNDGPPRCARCRAYLSPFVEANPNGKDGQCPFCTMTNPIPPPVDALNAALDMRAGRPELMYGTYEYVVGIDPRHLPPDCPFGQMTVEEEPKPQGVVMGSDKEPSLPTVVAVVIEATAATLQSGIFNAAVEGVRAALKSPNPHTRLVFFLAAESVKVLDIRPSGALTIVDIPDADNPFSPLPVETAAIPMTEGARIIEALETAGKVLKGTRAASPNTMGAVGVACEMIKEVGGRVVALVAHRPSTGAAALKARPSTEPGKDDHKLLQPAEKAKWYTDTRDKCRKHNVSVDVIALGPEPVDLATIDVLATGTGGQVTFIHHRHHAANATGRVTAAVKDALLTEHARAVMMKVRCSRGLALGNWYSPQTHGDHEKFAPAVAPHNTMTFDLLWEDKVISGNFAFLQAAAAYTAVDGTRRLRVSTLRMPVLRDQLRVYKAVDDVATALLRVRSVTPRIQLEGVHAVRKELGGAIVNPLAHYRMTEVDATNRALTMPESLSLLPLMYYVLGKNPALHPRRDPTEGGSITADERLAAIRELQTCSAERAAMRGYPLAVMLDGEELAPIRLNTLIHTDLTRHVLLLIDGRDAWVRIGREAVRNPWLTEVFATGLDQASQQRTILEGPLVLRDTAAAELVQATIDHLRAFIATDGPTFAAPGVIWEANSEDWRIKWLMAEDKTRIDQTYGEFLSTCHKTILTKTENSESLH